MDDLKQLVIAWDAAQRQAEESRREAEEAEDRRRGTMTALAKAMVAAGVDRVILGRCVYEYNPESFVEIRRREALDLGD